MLLIVAHHYSGSVLYGSEELISSDVLSSNSIFFYLFGMWGKTGINCFIMITGYFMCMSSISIRKYLKLYLWILTYGIIINTIFFLTAYESFNTKLLLMFIPFRNIESNSFSSAFMAWYLFIPFLNILIKSMTKKQHLLLIGLMVLVFTVYSFVPKILKIDVNPICWFSAIYFIASYIRKYPEAIYKNQSASFWGLVSTALIALSILSVISLLWINSHIHKELPQYWLVSDSEKPLALLVAVTTFLWFKNIKLRYSKLINILGAASFGVLLIHSNSATMREWLWNEVVDSQGHFSLPLPLLICYSTAIVLCIYIICTIIDYTRLKLLEEPFFKWYDKIPRFQKLEKFLTDN